MIHNYYDQEVYSVKDLSAKDADSKQVSMDVLTFQPLQLWN